MSTGSFRDHERALEWIAERDDEGTALLVTEPAAGEQIYELTLRASTR